MMCRETLFSRHAIERMFQRSITPETVRDIIATGEVIADYPEDTPYPSTLLLGFADRRPVHVVVASDPDSGLCHVITVYQPSPALWSDDFKTRRQA